MAATLGPAATDGRPRRAGDWLILPKGWVGTWENKGNYRELIAVERRSWEASASSHGAGDAE